MGIGASSPRPASRYHFAAPIGSQAPQAPLCTGVALSGGQGIPSPRFPIHELDIGAGALLVRGRRRQPVLAEDAVDAVAVGAQELGSGRDIARAQVEGLLHYPALGFGDGLVQVQREAVRGRGIADAWRPISKQPF